MEAMYIIVTFAIVLQQALTALMLLLTKPTPFLALI